MRRVEGPFDQLVSLVRTEMDKPKGKPPAVALVLRVEPGHVELHVEAKGVTLAAHVRDDAAELLDAALADGCQSLDELAASILTELAEVGLRREAARPLRRRPNG